LVLARNRDAKTVPRQKGKEKGILFYCGKIVWDANLVLSTITKVHSMNKKILLAASMVLLACACQKHNSSMPQNQNMQDDSNFQQRRQEQKQRQQGGCCEVEKPQAAPLEQPAVTAAPVVEQSAQKQDTVATPEVKVEAKAP
jgi:hypothetical protein